MQVLSGQTTKRKINHPKTAKYTPKMHFKLIKENKIQKLH
jgi:hypothetical protein